MKMLDCLPSELLQSIFLFLSPCDLENVSKVSQRWFAICAEVVKTRVGICSSAYRLEAPLRWTNPINRTNPETRKTFTPSKRFGSMIVHKDNKLFLFGGATNKFTTFNDLWVFDLTNLCWQRLLGEGDVPTPRAHARGGFIGDVLYLFGGCQSLFSHNWNSANPIEWLSDLFAFNPTTRRWSRIDLQHVDGSTDEEPQIKPGQSGCFLPAGPNGEPSLLVLFGGISSTLDSCSSELCIIAPIERRWFSLRSSETDEHPWPTGRCGHSVCALDSNRMLLLFGNSKPLTYIPRAGDHRARSFENSPWDSDGEPLRRYKGEPIGDMWILTRFHSKESPDTVSIFWHWTKIQCDISAPGCPPIDFYHMTATSLPYCDPDKIYTTSIDSILPISVQNVEHGNNTHSHTYSVICISQSTDQLLEEAQKQVLNHRMHRLRNIGVSPNRSASTSANGSPIISVDLPSTSNTNFINSAHPANSLFLHPNSDPPMLPSPSAVIPPQACLSSTTKRAKQLEALNNQELRLFGFLSNSNRPQQRSNSSSTQPNDPSCTSARPLAVYSLVVHIPESTYPVTPIDVSTPLPTSHWLVPRRLNYLDLLNAPPECLGFSCTFFHGALFLFGGLSESDEDLNNNHHNNPSNSNDSKTCLPSSLKPSHLYILQPRALLGTIV